MTIDTDKLRAAALKATPGPWIASGRYIGNQNHMSCVGEVRDQNGNWSDTAKSTGDAAFIAAANPTAIIALLDELDRLRAQNSNLLRRLGGEDDMGKLLFETNEQLRDMVPAARLEGYRLAQEQAEGICDYQTALEIRAMQPPAEWS